jgi:hypothetical protein
MAASHLGGGGEGGGGEGGGGLGDGGLQAEQQEPPFQLALRLMPATNAASSPRVPLISCALTG